jgi:hypothetical protein
MKLTNTQLEKAARAAERWPLNVECSTRWVFGPKKSQGCPATEAAREVAKIKAVVAGRVWQVVEGFAKVSLVYNELTKIWNGRKELSYPVAIDRGFGKEVAAVFRAAKTKRQKKTRIN